ncbi:GntR family transcriptional regulator [Alicyclobacillus tolerans]|uniref:GntR family transcriptional regulator n=1 Tax=Alicyclobacillus tolerans TaxID=90970 RepID=UPI001F47F49F|nr:GntR family transcriptional regulator [Alicyclobacillus tolerans]MCF8565879.1 GntR family transcriptional regulator [Alicyclobacillus tolerans]
MGTAILASGERQNAMMENTSKRRTEDAQLQSALDRFLSQVDKSVEPRMSQRGYLAIRHAILHLHLSPGETVLERKIADVLQMSRTPVREALVRLETEGWVRLIPRHGFVVSPIVADDLQQIYEVVEALDGVAGALAAVRAGEDELARLQELISEQERCLDKDDVRTWATLDGRFHSYIVDLAHNDRLHAIMDSQSDQIYRARLYTIAKRPKPVRSIVEHEAILAAMRAREPQAVRQLLQSHRSRGCSEILEVLRSSSQTPENDA